jgi:signal transduction histidine kinase
MTLRTRFLLTHSLVIGVTLVTLFGVTLLLGPTLHDDLMAAAGMPLHSTTGEMTAMALATERAFRDAMLHALVIAGGVALLIAAAVSVVSSQRLAAPITALLGASRRVAEGEYTQRIPAHGDAELRALAAQFNTMAHALASTEQRRQALIGDLAHELRTPLATIQGYAEGLLDGVVTADATTWALLRDEAARLTRLTADLAELSRADAHQLTLNRQLVAPATFVHRAAEVLTPPYQEHGVQLTLAVSAALPNLVIDEDRIVQVLVNLLSNALHATPRGGKVTLSVRNSAAELVIMITDTGSGIAPEHLPYIFDRFYRADRSRSRRTGGSGVGLTIARAIITAHGGTIQIESQGLGNGTTAVIRLPY